MSDSTAMLLYLFSTIPQVLAASFGVLGMFALYQLQQLREKMDGITTSDVMLDYGLFEGNTSYGRALSEDRWQDVDEMMEVAFKRSPSGGRETEFQQEHAVFRQHCRRYGTLKRDLWQSLPLSMLTIVGSLIMLWGVPYWPKGLLNGLGILLLVLTSVCLSLYSRVIMSALGISLPWQKQMKSEKKTN